LPLEAQQILIEKHLAGLLDAVPKERSKKGEEFTGADVYSDTLDKSDAGCDTVADEI
jgi:hypothetical protein